MPGAALARHGVAKVMYAFKGTLYDVAPTNGLAADSAGNFYGTIYTSSEFDPGAIFKLARDGTQSAFHVFPSYQGDGILPTGGLLIDSAGNIFGTTLAGGSGTDGHDGGTVFKIAPNGTETVLYSFTDQIKGAEPSAGLIEDRAGNLFGTTLNGGSGNRGTVFELTPDGTETVLYSFSGGADGANPVTKLIEDRRGDFYGTTPGGGNTICQSGCGVVFELEANGTEVVLHSFDSEDGYHPDSGLIRDKNGNLFGTTLFGGSADLGTVFKLAPNGTFTVLHSFGGDDGSSPQGELLEDDLGNLYGTTSGGGAHNHGTIYKISPDGMETVLFSFDLRHGQVPIGSLVAERNFRHLYGLTGRGGPYRQGVVFSFDQ
jgi:uncharacterized repeat protein (TIGR03803 family)